ncbi:hypothetical protein AKJ09_03692 [Labilithrix luteola]|uniref:HTH cro/C1-type domain-containing protein n=1 Tax=Labilithrix luteola TaxID=1391654 RepID=A0A0K1PU10_9BACT|nr:helix-turn-helix transcriptional regulator [Labilithrix luteola]AKU97028.1 hypothetical protein AKJ09_03692 [Labilithrix luteola]
MSLASRVEIALRQSGKKKIDIEQEAGLPKGYMTRIIAGERRNLGPEKIRRIAEALGVSYEWLGTESDEPPTADTTPVEAVLEEFDWPPGLLPADVEIVVKQLRQEAGAATTQLPRSYLRRRLQDLVAALPVNRRA